MSPLRRTARAAAARLFLLAAAALWPGLAATQPTLPPKPGFRVLDAGTVRAAQPELMAREVDDIRQGVPGRTELFAVLAAWFPNQRVFLREVEQAEDILGHRFGAEGRVVVLANSMADPMRHPLATAGHLEAAIEAVSARMNPGEDVLLVYLTSHGSFERIAGGRWPLDTRDLQASELALILDQADVPNTAVVISACRSGSFVPLIAAPGRLAIAASAADRNSFGCSDASDWTYFGEAFFDRALRETLSLPEAFGRAARLVARWEKLAGFRPSQPQMALGEKIAPVLRQLAEDAGRG